MNNRNEGKVGVVGGGLGGLAAACTLAARGYAVVLFEKQPWLGGKAALLEAEGYRFDMGPTILTLPSVLGRIFAEAGRALADALPMARLDPQWRSFFSDGSTLDLHADVGRMSRVLEEYAPESRSGEGYRDFLAFARRMNDISQRFFFWRPLGSVRDMFDWRSMFSVGMLRDVMAMRLGKSVARCVRAHVSDPRVAQMLDHFTQYVGSAPDESPAVLCGIAHMQTDEGVWYPEGGTAAVPRALAQLASDLGVEVRRGVGVERILLDEGNRVAGVRTDTGEEIPLAAVVSNCDAVRTHRELLADTKAARRFEKRRTYEPACSGVVLYLGLSRRYSHLLHHNFVFSRDPEVEFESIYRAGEPAADPTCYVCAPSATDPGVAPPGGEALYVLVHTPYLRPGHDWGRMFPAYRQTILNKLAATAGLDDLPSRIRFEARLTPQEIHDRYRVLNGAIYGLASHGKMFGAFKPANRSRDVKGLYLAGGAAHPGPGMPMVLMSGWIAADALDQDEIVRKQGRPSRSAADAGFTTGTPSHHTPAREAYTPEVMMKRSPWMVRWFTRYSRRYLGRSFHTVRLARDGKPVDPQGDPLIVVLNHPSWWDPLMGIVLADRLFNSRQHYVPFDASTLANYGFFRKLGFFGVEQGTLRGAAEFLRTGLAILSRPDTALWVTAQGRFADPRERPLTLSPGVGHLARRLGRGVILPLALEYPFWEEKYPEALARFGMPLVIGDHAGLSAQEWTGCIEHELTSTMDLLARDAIARNAEAFEVVLGGSAGVGGIYDRWRRFKAWLRGEPFRASHGGEEVRPTLEGSR
jgi:phytoene desaturase